MKRRITRFLATLVAVLAWSSSAYAGCTNAQFAGTWDVVFSDGNSCSLVLNIQGEVLIDGLDLSTCFDPFRGTTDPEFASFTVASDCLAAINLVVEGNAIFMFARFAEPRNIGAGFFIVVFEDPLINAEKGNFTIVRNM